MVVVHLFTRVETIFGVVDEAGNVKPYPIRLEIERLDEKIFLEALGLLQIERAKLGERKEPHAERD